MLTSLFDYHLPPERIAQTPMEPRDHSRLLVLDRKTGEMQDRHIFDLPDLLAPGDLLVLNDSRVFKARLRARIMNHVSRIIELFLLRPENGYWLALAKPAKRLNVGDTLIFSDDTCCVIHDKCPDGTLLLDFQMKPEDVFALADRIGEVPTPPYVHAPATPERYQTIYAKTTGSVAAPTAGFHFTEDLFRRLEERGVGRAFVTLHVGLGTFRPIKTETLEEHQMHSEWAEVPQEVCDAIAETKNRGHRVVVVGTTALRALESASVLKANSYQLKAFSDFTNIFITPGYQFRVTDALITNFHLPKSTLLVLVSAFANREQILKTYSHAIQNEYRFYSFGDAMLIV